MSNKRSTRRPSERARLLGDLARSAQRAATDGILFHQAVADRLGLHVSDLRCLNILLEAGSAPAGEIGERTGLTTGAVTRMVDRLERAGYVRREPDPADRRRVIVSPVAERMARIGPMYTGMAEAWATAMNDYDDEQLTVILTLFDRLHEITQVEVARLRDDRTHDTTQ
jgi:DNA-binding MarR family transcriptional regulator